MRKSAGDGRHIPVLKPPESLAPPGVGVLMPSDLRKKAFFWKKCLFPLDITPPLYIIYPAFHHWYAILLAGGGRQFFL